MQDLNSGDYSWAERKKEESDVSKQWKILRVSFRSLKQWVCAANWIGSRTKILLRGQNTDWGCVLFMKDYEGLLEKFLIESNKNMTLKDFAEWLCGDSVKKKSMQKRCPCNFDEVGLLSW